MYFFVENLMLIGVLSIIFTYSFNICSMKHNLICKKIMIGSEKIFMMV